MPGIEIILAAFFGLCTIIGVAPHVKYEKPSIDSVTVRRDVLSVGQSATFDSETGERIK